MPFRTLPCAGLALFCLLAHPALAQPATGQQAALFGRITDAETADPLPGASVILMQPGTENMAGGTSTRPDGYFSLRADEGLYDLVVRYIGYQEIRRTLALGPGEQREVNVVLERGVDLNPVVVTVSRNREAVLDAPASISVLRGLDFARDPAPSPAAVLRNVPGVDIARVGVDRYQLALRGFNETLVSRVHVLVDNRDVTTPNLGLNAFALMPLSPIDLAGAEITRGPASALYGAGVEQGVIHFLTKGPFAYPGTTVLLGGGERSLVQGSVRHAAAAPLLGGQLGYKVVGYYSQAQDWAFDPADPADLDVLCEIARGVEGGASECVRRPDGTVAEVVRLAARDDESWKGYLAGEAHYRFAPRRTLRLRTGYASMKQVVPANTGENQVDGFGSLFAQAQLEAERLSVQASVNKNNAGDTYVVRTGADLIDDSVELAAQARYGLDFFAGKQTLDAGVDYQVTLPETGGTVNGINEADDTLREAGGYVHSHTRLTHEVDLVLAARLDWNNVNETVQFSPRAGMIFHPDPVHTFRITYNRAFTTPAGVNLFLDLPIAPASANGGLFGVRGRGAARAFTFSDETLVSLTPPLADAIGVDRVPLGELPLAGLYGYGLGAATASGALATALSDLGITGGDADAVLAVLAGAAARLPGTVGGVLQIDGQEAPLADTAPLDQSSTTTVELGYKALVSDRLTLGADLYFTRKLDFISGLQQITPLALAGPDGAATLAAALTEATGGDLADLGLTPAQAETLLSLLAETAAATPYGVVEPEQNVGRAEGGAPEVLLTYLNFGEVDYFGADIAAEWRPTDALSLFGSYSWISSVFFDEGDLEESGSGRVIAANAPRNKFAAGFFYRSPSSGISVNAAARYTGDFAVRSGVFQGDVESYLIFDVGAGYDFGSSVPGLRVDVLAQNVLDNQHREYIGAPRIGRLATARAVYSF